MTGLPSFSRITRFVLTQAGPVPDVQAVHDPLPMGPDDVRVAVIQTPILPSDLNIVSGTYAYHPPLPYALGREGVGRVVSVGARVTRVTVGDRVIGIDPYPAYGFWATETVLPESAVWVVPDAISDAVAATLAVNGLTAWLLLTQFKSGDGVIQNAANSSVGAWVNYWATELGIHIINVVRRPDAVSEVLQPAGPIYIEGQQSVPQASVGLALNAVGGPSAGLMLKALSPRGTLVTYGALAQLPIPVSNAAFIYRQLTLTGFLRSEWVRQMGADAVRVTLDHLASILSQRVISLPAGYPMLFPQNGFTGVPLPWMPPTL